MEFILDFQGFKGENNKFIVKELAIVSTDELVYELHLFRPPCDFNQLSENVKKQVVWLEKYFHGLYWSSGFREYSQLNDLLKNCNLSGNVYVKGTEKTQFVKNLLTDFKVNVINIEDLGCPSLSVIRSQTQTNAMKKCIFDHNPINCAYINVHLLLQWFKLEKLVQDRLNTVNLAIKECYKRGYLNLQTELVQYLPKDFLINHKEDLELIFDRLPVHLKSDPDILRNMRCTEHFTSMQAFYDSIDGPNPKRKDCYFCVCKYLPPPVV